MKSIREFTKGLWDENPIFVMLLGLCPTLATTNSIKNAFCMGVAATGVLCGSNIIISAMRKFIPSQIRIPCFIVVIASFVTIVDLLMGAYLPPEIYAALGIFIPLIVVNCVILGRAEAFASKNSVGYAALDGLGMGLGFTLALVMLGAAREFFGQGTLLDVRITRYFAPRQDSWVLAEPMAILVQPAGAFLVIGCYLALFNHWKNKKATPGS